MAKYNKSANEFINVIQEKTKFSIFKIIPYIKYRRKLKNFKKEILNGSPDFYTLWIMADFIKLAEYIFFYNNSIKDEEIGLYSSKGFIPGQNGFKVHTKECTIVIKLFSETEKVVVELERNTGERDKSVQSFIKGKWETKPDTYNEMLLEQTIKIINSSILNLFNWCYDRR